MELFLVIGAGALVAGFVSGLAGFGTGLVSLGFWLHAVEPILAAPLVVICSVAGQLQATATLRRVGQNPLFPALTSAHER